jgi:hypothetical protein
MTMRKTHEAKVSIGEYNGKKVYSRVGTMFTDDQTGNMSLKLDVLPFPKIGKDGFPCVWVSIFPADREGGGGYRQNDHNQSKSNGYQRQPEPPMQGRYSQADYPPAAQPTDPAPDGPVGDNDIPF